MSEREDSREVSPNKLSILKLGERIKELRRRSGKSLQKLAEEVGVSKGFLSQIETGKVNPSLDTLWSIADRLRIHVADLFKISSEEELIVESAYMKDSHGAQCYVLSPRFLTDFEFSYMEFPPGSGSGEKPAQHQGTEYFLVIEGEIQFQIGVNRYLLKKNQGVYFSGEIPHYTWNNGKETARTVFVIAPSAYNRYKLLGY